MPDNDSDRLTRLEKKVDWIIRLVAIQLALTCLFAVSYGLASLLQAMGKIFLLCLVALPLLYIFRDSLPATARAAGKRVGSFLVASFRRLRASSQR